MSNFDAWLAQPPPATLASETAKRFAHTKAAKVSKTNPRSSIDCPHTYLEEREYFNVLDREEDRKVQIQEIIAFEREDLGEWRREYRGYGRAYLKDGRRFAARGEAQFVLLSPEQIPSHVKQRLDTQPWPPRRSSS